MTRPSLVQLFLARMTSAGDSLTIAGYFIYYRWLLQFSNRATLAAWQAKKLAIFLRETLPQAEFFQNIKHGELKDLPLMDKQIMMEHFSAYNTRAIGLEQALSLATTAETTRDFNPAIGDITVGMSSGTSGKRGVFLVSKKERLHWAGSLLAKTLPSHLLQQLAMPWRAPLRIAFFLRANSNLYNTLNSRRIDFQFYDLLKGVETAIPLLNARPPHALVAPATVLRRLAQAKRDGSLQITPSHIISVAEVLEAEDADFIESAFALRPQQIYQATEGFLGYSCAQGGLHLNESHLHIEKEWLDHTQTRFHPLITDFSRSTQLIVRYRLNDILQPASQPCSCGRADLTLAAIEGRADEIFWLAAIGTKQPQPIYPDLLRRSMMLVQPPLSDYTLVQQGAEWQIYFASDADRQQTETAIGKAIAQLCCDLQVAPPALSFYPWSAPAAGAKRRRLICAQADLSSEASPI